MSNPATAVASRKDVLAFLQNDNVKKQVALALPKHMNADRMLRVMLTTVNAAGYVGEKLRQCTPESLIAALMKCSQYGLEPDGRHAHLIPYGKECQLIFDYKGLVALVRRSGEVKTIHADVVYENDEFSYCYGTGAHLRHKPTLKEDRGEIIAAYSFVVSSTGEESFEVLSVEDINAVRDSSQGYKYAKDNKKQTPWDSYYAEMCKKTAFRRHSKWLPLSFETKEAINSDEELTEEQRFQRAKPVAGLFGADKAAELPPPSDDSLSEPEPPKDQKAAEGPKAAASTPTAKPENVAAEKAQTQAKSSPLANDKTILADWMAKQKIGWDKLQPILIKQGDMFPFADSTASFDELTPEQCKAIFKAKTGIEGELDNLPM